MVVEDSAGDGRRKQTMLLSRCLFRGPLDARPRFHITRKVMNLPITGLTKRAYLARPLPVRLESVLKKKKRDSADGVLLRVSPPPPPFPPGRGGRARQTGRR